MQSRDELRKEERRFYAWIGIASAAHVAVIAAVVAVQLLYVRMHPPLKVVNISLVQMPGAPGQAGGAKSFEAPAPPVEKPQEAPEPAAAKKAPEPPPKPTPEKKIPEPAAVKKIPEKVPAKKPEPAPKKESPEDSRKNLNAALERLKSTSASKKPEPAKAAPPRNLSSTLADLEKKVASRGAGSAPSGSGSGAGGGRFGSGGGGAFDPYMAQIAAIIQNNWSFSTQMVRSNAGLEVYVSLQIMPDGTVGQIRYDRKSSSEYLNNSVKVALAKSIPFPAPPREGGAKSRWVGFVFTPEGVGQR